MGWNPAVGFWTSNVHSQLANPRVLELQTGHACSLLITTNINDTTSVATTMKNNNRNIYIYIIHRNDSFNNETLIVLFKFDIRHP